MSRGKNGGGACRRNKTLAWYMDNKTLDRVDTNQERETFSPAPKRKNSFDSEGSNNSRQAVNENDERKRRANKAKGTRNRSQNSQSNDQSLGSEDMSLPSSQPIPIRSSPANDSLVGSDQQSAVLQQQLMAMSSQTTIQKENYWYYDQNTDGYFYEFCGSRGWRKRNPKLHGNPPLNATSKMGEEHHNNVPPVPQTIEKKVYVPIPVPVFPNGKFFPQAGTSPNIKYFDSNGFYYETPHAEIWKKRTSTNPTSMHGNDLASQRAKPVEPSSLTSFPPLSRDLTSQELEELILAKVKNSAPIPSVPFASVVAKNIRSNAVQRPNVEVDNPYPSSSSTVSSSVSDDATPPPATIGKENQCQQLFAQTKEPVPVGSFDEPYEFYWSDSEKTENAQQTEQASSVSSMDDYNPLSAYFNEMSMNNVKQNVRVQRPSSLKIINPTTNDKRLPCFNVDKFIADLPNNDAFMNGGGIYGPFGSDSPRTPFNNNYCQFDKYSPMFTPMVPKERPWRHFGTLPVDEIIKEKASADNIERGLRDIEKIWQTS